MTPFLLTTCAFLAAVTKNTGAVCCIHFVDHQRVAHGPYDHDLFRTIGSELTTIDFCRLPHLCNRKEVASIATIIPINTTIGVVAIAIIIIIIIIISILIVRPLRNPFVRPPANLFGDLDIRTTPGTTCTPYTLPFWPGCTYVRYAVQGSRSFIFDTHVECQVVKFKIDAAIEWPSGILSGCTHLWHGKQRLPEPRTYSFNFGERLWILPPRIHVNRVSL